MTRQESERKLNELRKKYIALVSSMNIAKAQKVKNKIEQLERELEKHGRYVAIPGDKTRTRIFVRNGEDAEKKIAAYLERINNRPQKWN